jgi:hypothetical protein
MHYVATVFAFGSVCQSRGQTGSVIQNYHGLLPGTRGQTVGLLTADEPSTFVDGVSTPISTKANSIQKLSSGALSEFIDMFVPLRNQRTTTPANESRDINLGE